MGRVRVVVASRMSQGEKAELLLGYHHAPPDPRAPERVGCREREDAGGAAGLPRAGDDERRASAACLGYEDGEQTPAAEMVECAATDCSCGRHAGDGRPRAGYGDWVGTARAAWDGGVVGMNFEDSAGGKLVPVDEQVDAIREIPTAVPKLVI